MSSTVVVDEADAPGADTAPPANVEDVAQQGSLLAPNAPESLFPPNPGMERGYALSPMAEIHLEYLREEEDETSLFSRMTWLASKKSLEPKELIDRAINSRPRFGMEPAFGLRLEKTLWAMQLLLKRAAALIPARATWFVIDPHDALFPILRGAMDLDEVHIAWTALNKRIALSQDFLEKYEAEYKIADPSLRPTSPASTNPGIYDAFPHAKANISKLMYLYDNVPHLQTLLPKEYDRDTGYLPDHLSAPERLKAYFPDRLVEEYPSTVYYSATGERMERSWPTRSSWKAGENFELPEEETVSQRHERRVTIQEPEGGYSQRHYEEEEFPSVSTAQHWDLPPTHHAIMGSQTPFKTADEFFPLRSPSSAARATRVPGPNLPDPLYGLASSGPYGLRDESISQGIRQRRDAPDNRYVEWTSGASATPVRRQIYAEVTPNEERLFHDRRGRETPPHMSSRRPVVPAQQSYVGMPQDSRDPLEPNWRGGVEELLTGEARTLLLVYPEPPVEPLQEAKAEVGMMTGHRAATRLERLAIRDRLDAANQ
ncbi:hypothetical protein C8R44DRAFT_894173 [Mycena epipterygia]|nr:hypothetical protein C8R44DRAFT_894173 [Mycena epipterygia]